MTASAFRRIEEDQSALREYEKLVERFPDNEECKRGLRQMLGKIGRH